MWRYNKFDGACKPPTRNQNDWSSARMVWEKIKFCRDMRRDEVSPIGGTSVQFGNECVGGETLILLSDAGLQQQIQLAPREGLNQQFLRPLMVERNLSGRNHLECRFKPLRKADRIAKLVDLYLGQFNCHLNATLPT